MNRQVTEAGSTPSVDWPRATLGDDIELISGVHIDAADYHSGPNGVPYLTGPSDFAGGVIRKTKFTNLPGTLCESGDILLTVKGSGTGTLVRADTQYCISRQLMAIRVRTWCQDFIYYVLSSHSRDYQSTASGLIPGITREHVLGTVLHVPPLAEQQAIAAVLSAWDRAIGQTTALIAAKQRLKQGLMQQLLSGTKRFKGSKDKWITCHIGDLLTEVRRYVTVEDDTSYRLVSVRRNSGGMFDRETRLGRDIGYSKLMTVETGDFLIARRQVIHGAMTIVRKRFHGAYVSDAYAILVPKAGAQLHMPYLDILSQDPRMYYSAFRCSYGVAIEKMVFHLEWFLREKVTIPPTIGEQKRIADVLTELDREVRQLERRHSALQKQKRGVMQKLLTGERRVSPKLLRKFSHD